MDAQFLDLDIGETADEHSPKNAREERIKRAFEKSRASYKEELVYLTPGVRLLSPHRVFL